MLARPSHLVETVIGCAIDVHRALGPGLLESAYSECMVYELVQKAVAFRRQVIVPVIYKAIRLDCGFRADLIVDEQLLIELKSVDRVLPIHQAQMLTYLKLLRLPQGLLINFNVRLLTDGLKNFLLDEAAASGT